MIGRRLIGAVMVAAGVVYPSAVSANLCVTFSTAEYFKMFPAVFEATVTSARGLGTGQVLTVDVRRVWKGEVGEQRILLHSIFIDGKGPSVVGQTYVIFAEELHPQDTLWRNRNDLKLTGQELVPGCDGIIPIEQATRVLTELGPARPSSSR